MSGPSAKDMLLYWGSGSPPCWRLMIVLEEKGFSGYQSKQIEFSNQGHKSEEILKINPRGQVPTFKYKDIVINESFAACIFLDDMGKVNPLIPTDPAKKGRVLQRMFEVPSFARKCEDVIYPYMFNAANLDEEKMKTSKENVRKELALWEGYLTETGGPFIAGADFSMADAILFPHVAFLVRLGAKYGSSFPKLAAYYDTMSKRPSVQKAWPPHFKTTEPKTFLADLC